MRPEVAQAVKSVVGKRVTKVEVRDFEFFVEFEDGSYVFATVYFDYTGASLDFEFKEGAKSKETSEVQ